jgi:hypothetical protein
VPLSERMKDRYTPAHSKHYSESTNDEFAEDLEKKEE